MMGTYYFYTVPALTTLFRGTVTKRLFAASDLCCLPFS